MKKIDLSKFNDEELNEWYDQNTAYVKNCDLYPSLFNLFEPIIKKVDEELEKFGLEIELYHESDRDPHEFNYGFKIKERRNESNGNG